MGGISYVAHVSNGKSAITTKRKLEGAAKHNLRKYKSDEYSAENIMLLYGTENLVKDVKKVYHDEFDWVLKEYNDKQTRKDRKISDYYEYVSEKSQDMAVEIIFQVGDMKYWQEHGDNKVFMKRIFKLLLDELRDRMPDFKVANAVIHFDEESPHMHVVGVPVAAGFKKSLRKQVSKRSVFTPYTLSKILQGDLREFIDEKVSVVFGEQIKEKSKGRNHDLTVAEYKVAKETEKLELLGDDIDRKEKSLADIKGSIELQSAILDYTKDELEEKQHQADRAVKVLEQMKRFVGMFHLLAPTIEEYATAVEKDGRLDTGNSYRGILYELGKLLERFKEMIKEGLCWFPRLMRWKTSVGEVAPVFRDTDNGYSYSVCGYMNVETKVQYSKEDLQCEISAEMRIGTMETLDANIEAMERDLAEILRLSGEQERLWKAYEDWKGR